MPTFAKQSVVCGAAVMLVMADEDIRGSRWFLECFHGVRLLLMEW